MSIKNDLLKSSALAIAMVFFFAAISWAVVPPPPVNQNLGIPDGNFSDLTQPQCRGCHESRNPGWTHPNPLRIPDRHHATVSRDGNQCLDCHDLVQDAAGNLSLGIFRDCPYCHEFGRPGLAADPADTPLFCKDGAGKPLPQADCAGPDGDFKYWTNWILLPGSPHHKTIWAQQKFCRFCHGSLVNVAPDAGPNLDGSLHMTEDPGHEIPTYEKSFITPNTCRPADPNVDPGMVGPGNPVCTPQMIAEKAYNSCPTTDPVTGQCIGGCRSCHIADPTGLGRPDGKPIGSNQDNHHQTGLGTARAPNTSCFFCHGDISAGQEIRDMRKCEDCHGRTTLHNIIFDYDTNKGTHGYGHVGVSQDCWGCHGWFDKYDDFVPGLDATPANITGSDYTSIAVGEAPVVTLTGSNFQNCVNQLGVENCFGVEAIEIQDRDGNKVTITPDSVTASEVKGTIPATLQPGVHTVRVIKKGKPSNPVSLDVRLEPVISRIKVVSRNEDGTIRVSAAGQNLGIDEQTVTLLQQKVKMLNGVYIQGNGKVTKLPVESATDTEVIFNAPANACGTLYILGNNGHAAKHARKCQ